MSPKIESLRIYPFSGYFNEWYVEKSSHFYLSGFGMIGIKRFKKVLSFENYISIVTFKRVFRLTQWMSESSINKVN